MKDYELLDAIGGIDAEFVEHAARKERTKRFSLRAVGPVAACLRAVAVLAIAAVLLFGAQSVLGLDFFQPQMPMAPTSSSLPGALGSLPSDGPKQGTDTVLKEVFPLQAGGAEITPKQEIFSDTELPTSLPIYENKYPVSHGGPQYEFDEAVKEELEQAMNSFLELLYDEAELPLPASGFSISEPEEGKEQGWNHRRAFETDDFSLFGWPGLLRTKLSLHVSDPLVLSIEAGDADALLENFAVRAAMRYVGIDNSQIDLQRLDDDTFEYQIMEASESIEEAVYRTAFASVRVELLCMNDRAVLYVDACRLEPEKLAEVDAFSRDEVMAFVQQNHPDSDVDAATCKLYFESAIEQGQYRPCYKVENETGETVYVAPYLPEESAGE